MLENSHKPYLAQYIGSQLKTLRRIQEGAPYLLCTYYFPPELLQLFDIEALYIERIVGLTVSTGLYTESSDALPETICSYQSAFASLVERKILPKPRCLLAMEFPCPDAVRLMEYLQETYQIPLVRITRENMRQDLQRAVDFLHSHYERSRSESEVSRLFNRANEYKRKIDDAYAISRYSGQHGYAGAVYSGERFRRPDSGGCSGGLLRLSPAKGGDMETLRQTPHHLDGADSVV